MTWWSHVAKTAAASRGGRRTVHRNSLGLSAAAAASSPAAATSTLLLAVGVAASVVVVNKKDEETDNKEVDSIVDAAGQSSSRFFLQPPPLCLCDGAQQPPSPSPKTPFSIFGAVQNLRKHQTVTKLNVLATRDRTLTDTYDIQAQPLGEGAFGKVYLIADRSTNEKLALKKIPKRLVDAIAFQREMDALLRIKKFGGHPYICGLREHFDDGTHYSVVLDLVGGGELFDHLVDNGAYSEADAARLVSEIASALDFMHGIGVVHTDLKPENCMLSSKNRSDSVIKVVDFGCANVMDESGKCGGKLSGGTVAYLSPESFLATAKVTPAVDMWAVGCIIYIMLTGAHPFDVYGDASDAELQSRIRTKEPGLGLGSKLTEHLSPSAIELMTKLMERNPDDRLTAHELLEHPWVRGETARTVVMADSDKRLAKFRKFKSRMEAKVFADFVSWSDGGGSGIGRRSLSKKSGAAAMDKDQQGGASLIERAFHSFDKKNKGFLTVDDLDLDGSKGKVGGGESDEDEDASLSLSGFASILGENLKNRYYPRGHVIVEEGDAGGKSMYFINSGTVSVSTKGGFHTELGQGDSFGEGALLQPGRARTATATCKTPVHAIEVDKDFFLKYLSSGEADLVLRLKEKDKTRAFDRVEMVLSQQENLKASSFRRGQPVYVEGDKGDNTIYVLEEGEVDARAKGHSVYTVKPGDVFGERPLLLGKPCNVTSVCVSEQCKVKSMSANQFHRILDSSPAMKSSLRELCLRREFQKAVVLKTKKSFPSADNLKEAFDAVNTRGTGSIETEDMRELLKECALTEEEIEEVISTLDLDGGGSVCFEEFTEIFGKDE